MLQSLVWREGCALHTQTGSMSNTVTTEASLVERDNCTEDSLGGMGDVTKPGVGRGCVHRRANNGVSWDPSSQ